VKPTGIWPQIPIGTTAAAASAVGLWITMPDESFPKQMAWVFSMAIALVGLIVSSVLYVFMADPSDLWE
jgi:hypothetical protein